jgi:hypothetical protein
MHVEIEFRNNNTVSRFGYQKLNRNTGTGMDSYFLQSDLSTQQLDSILKPLNWTRETLKTLKRKLDNAGCIQIASGEPTEIGFQRSGMSMYFFNVFDRPIPDRLKAGYNDSCAYILVNDSLVLEYGSGAIGSQCFYNKE